MLQLTVNDHDEKINNRKFILLRKLNLVAKLQAEIDKLNSRVSELERIISELQKALNEKGKVYYSKFFSGNVTQIREAPKEIIKEIIKEKTADFDPKGLATLEQIGDLSKKIEKLEKEQILLHETDKNLKDFCNSLDGKTKENTIEIEKIKEKLLYLEKALKGKVDCEDYDKLLLILNQIREGGDKGKTIPIPSGPIMGSKEINLLKEIGNKVPEMEQQIQDLLK